MDSLLLLKWEMTIIITFNIFKKMEADVVHLH